jgi:hypothetical protein
MNYAAFTSAALHCFTLFTYTTCTYVAGYSSIVEPVRVFLSVG